MTQWTDSARDELERYLARVAAAVSSPDADAAEVSDDLRRHIEQEVAVAKLTVVTEEDVRRIAARLGVPEPARAPTSAPPTAESPQFPAMPVHARASVNPALVIFGVILPALTLAIESMTGMCAGAFFDPIPTLWHALLVALVPLINGLTWLAAARRASEYRVRLGWLNGVAAGIACFYTLLYLPLLLPGLIAIFFLGSGLLPLTPVLAFISTLYFRGNLNRLGPEPSPQRLPGLWRGWLIAWLVLAAIEIPVWATRVALQMAVSEVPDSRMRGLGWLRTLGHERTLLRACYGRTPWAENMDLVGWLVAGARNVGAEQAREVYYQTTGRPFNSVPAPNVRTGRGRWAALDEFTWDTDQGGENVGARVRGLTLRGSRLDAVLNGDTALSYGEWILEFRNDSPVQREARAQVLLPPGGIVTRLTLWVNGEEREAAFAGRSQVREAYQKIAIQRRRDPVLVTTCGPDRVLMQCFPVPPNGGLMKVRLGITAPLRLAKLEEGLWNWPCFLERNFTLTEQFRHSVWVEAKTALTASGNQLSIDQSKPGTHALRGRVTDAELSAPSSVIRVQRAANVRVVWVKDTLDSASQIIQQRLEEQAGARPKRVVAVLDGSVGIEEDFAAVAAALRDLPTEIELGLIVAADGVLALSDPESKADSSARQAALESLRRRKARGGQDNLPALEQAWDWAARTTNGVVVWIHGPQPVLLGSVDGLLQRYERRPSGPPIFELQTRVGPNRIAEKLDGFGGFHPLPRSGTVGEDLGRLLDSWQAGAKAYSFNRERLRAPAPTGETVREGSPHLARLWAREEVTRLQAARRTGDAVQLAGLYQLVTPVSGAVVLETRQQYVETGLQPADPVTVPAIPEPATWLLLLLGGFVLVVTRRRWRRSCCSRLP